MDSNRQLEIDFSRAGQLAILRDAILPLTNGNDGRGVKGSTLKMVLGTLDHYGRGHECWPSLGTIAEKSCLSVRQTRRAIEGLESLGVLIVDRKRFSGRKASGNHYRLVWSELALLCPDRRANQVATGADQVATGADQVATGADQVATGGHQTVKKHLEAPPPLNPLRSDIAETTAEYDQAAAELSEAGYSLAGKLVGEARDLGISGGELREFVQTYRANRTFKRLTPGAIAFRVRHGEWPANGVLPPQAIEAKQAVAVAEEQARRQEQESDHREHDAARAELAKLERVYGEALNSLDASQLWAAVKAVFPEGLAREVATRAIREHGRPPAGSYTRLQLLRWFEEWRANQ